MSSQFSAVLLAGGKSSRMGEDKAFISIAGEPLWRRQLRLLRSLEPRELFIAGSPHPEWLRECSVIADAQPDAGPLAGLVSALRQSSAPLLLALAVDLPWMTAKYLRELVDSLGGLVPHGQPLAAIYPASALALAERCLENGDYSMQKFAMHCVSKGLVRLKEISAADEPLFLNMNTPADFLAATDA